MQTSTPPMRRHSRVAKCYSTLIANLLKLAHQELLPQVPFIWENAVSYG